LTAVVANGHVVRLTASTCTIDGVTMPYGEVPRSTSPGQPLHVSSRLSPPPRPLGRSAGNCGSVCAGPAAASRSSPP
jgi:hypothetical protein